MLPLLLVLALLAAGCLTAIRAFLDHRLTRANEFLLFMHKGGLGDGFCQTGLMRALRAKSPGMRFIVITRYPELFQNLPEVSFVVDLSRHAAFSRWRVHALLRVLRLRRAHDFVYKPQRQTPKAKLDANPAWRPHLVQLAAERLRVPADFADVRGSLVFSADEHRRFAEKHAALPAGYAVVAPTGKTSYTPNKEWGFENHVAVTGAMPDVAWVQVGLAADPALPRAVDLRGKTGVREMAWLISRAKFVLCGEGLHNHLAGALGTPCFVVHSGFNYTGFSKYPATRPILVPEAPPCAPCFLKTPCPVPGKPCTGRITPAQVVSAIRAHASFAA